MVTYQEHITQSSHKIRVWDGLLTYQQQARLMNLIFKMPFGFAAGYDTIMLEQKSKICCKCPLTTDWLKKNEFLHPNHVGLVTFKDIAPLFSLDTEEAKPIADILEDRVMARAWVNAGTASDPHSAHVDSNYPDAIVLLQCINLKWDKNWDGYTVFRTQDQENLEFASEFVPGRVVLFDGDIPHKATSQSYDAPAFRFTANSMWIKEEDYFKQVKR
jgi:hypothetical protein